MTVNSNTGQSGSFSGPSFTSAGTTLAGGNTVRYLGPPEPGSFNLVTLYSYDALGNLLCVEQHGDGSGNGCSGSPTYDANSAWRVRRFTYDSLSRLTSSSNPEANTALVNNSLVRVNTTYLYDANDKVLQKSSPAPNQTGTATQTISYCYDALNRVTGKAYSAQTCTNGFLPANTAVVSYGYDSGTNGIGHMTSLTDQAGSGSYMYDIMGRVSSESRTIAGVTKNMSYTYNLAGTTQNMVYPSGATVSYTPDAAGRMLSAIDSGHNVNYATGAAYGPDGALTAFISGQTTSFAGITNSFSFNNRLQPCRMTSGTGAMPSSCTDINAGHVGNVVDISYDFHVGNGTSGSDSGNVWGIINNKDTSRNQTFTYDVLNRLTSAQNAGTDCNQTVINGRTKFWGNSYGYDAWGNLLGKSLTKCSAENLSLISNVQNRADNGNTNPAQNYDYDAAGNMTHDVSNGGVNYTYDAENRITGAAGYTYTYDADGNRVEKSNGANPPSGTLYWYMTPGIVGESDLAGILKTEYVFFDGERVARRDFPAGTVSYYFSDHLKTASVVTDATGTILDESDYYPWGGELQFVNSLDNHYKFTGKERDSETGLDYFGARYYGSLLGRFTSSDPHNEGAQPTEPQSWNSYSYVANNPLRHIDPDGRDYHVCAFGGECQDMSDRDFEKWQRAHPEIERTPSGDLYYKPEYVGGQTGLKVGNAAWFDGDAARRSQNAIDVVNWFVFNQSLEMVGGAGSAAIARVAPIIAELFPLVVRNGVKGKVCERIVEATLRLKGYKIVGRHVTASTSEGIRYVDYIVEKEGRIMAIEVKTGKAARDASQLAKDAAMSTKGAKIGNNGGVLQGQTLKIKTAEVHPF